MQYQQNLPPPVATQTHSTFPVPPGAGLTHYESVRTILLGGGGTAPALQAGIKALFPRASVHTAYGMTEACSSMTFHTLWAAPLAAGPAAGAAPLTTSPGAGGGAGPEDAMAAAWAAGDSGITQHGRRQGALGVAEEGQPGGGSGGVYVGMAPPGIELAVFHAPLGSGPASAASPGGGSGSGGTAWGRVAAQGEGEIVTRGPHVMLGYWEDEDATQGAFLPGGWMRTGDLGCMYQGARYACGRVACSFSEPSREANDNLFTSATARRGSRRNMGESMQSGREAGLNPSKG